MTYKKDGEKIVRDGKIIYEISDAEPVPNDAYVEAILDDSNMGNPQKDALKALLLGPEKVHEDDSS